MCDNGIGLEWGWVTCIDLKVTNRALNSHTKIFYLHYCILYWNLPFLKEL